MFHSYISAVLSDCATFGLIFFSLGISYESEYTWIKPVSFSDIFSLWFNYVQGQGWRYTSAKEAEALLVTPQFCQNSLFYIFVINLSQFPKYFKWNIQALSPNVLSSRRHCVRDIYFFMFLKNVLAIKRARQRLIYLRKARFTWEKKYVNVIFVHNSYSIIVEILSIFWKILFRRLSEYG